MSEGRRAQGGAEGAPGTELSPRTSPRGGGFCSTGGSGQIPSHGTGKPRPRASPGYRAAWRGTPRERASSMMRSARARPIPRPRYSGLTNIRFISHIPADSPRRATRPAGSVPPVPVGTRARRSAPEGGAYFPGRVASSFWKPWKERSSPRNAAYSSMSTRAVAMSKAAEAVSIRGGLVDLLSRIRSAAFRCSTRDCASASLKGARSSSVRESDAALISSSALRPAPSAPARGRGRPAGPFASRQARVRPGA